LDLPEVFHVRAFKRVFCFAMLATVAMCGFNGCGGSASTADSPSATSESGAPAAKQVAFATDIQPLVQSRCADCHMGDKAKGGFSMNSLEDALKPGQKGPRVIPGDSANSRMYLAITASPGVKKMPPKGEPLNTIEIDAIKAWIDQGAK
jgi:mono/diheme cytochrome c family protein